MAAVGIPWRFANTTYSTIQYVKLVYYYYLKFIKKNLSILIGNFHVMVSQVVKVRPTGFEDYPITFDNAPFPPFET